MTYKETEWNSSVPEAICGQHISCILLERPEDNLTNVSRDQTKVSQQDAGQLGLVTSITKIEAAFTSCLLSAVKSTPQIQEFQRYSKVVKG